MEGGESRGEAVTDGNTLRKEEGGEEEGEGFFSIFIFFLIFNNIFYVFSISLLNFS